MSYLGAEPSSIPLINRGAAEVNNPTAAAPYKAVVSTVPLINQGGGVYNYPEIYGASTTSYTPPARARQDTKLLLLVASAAAMWLALGVGGKGRYLW